MAKNSTIQWTTHTFNPWWGCKQIRPGCDNCYAKTMAYRFGDGYLWNGDDRRVLGDGSWDAPLKWNNDARKLNSYATVFSASMSDVFDAQGPTDARDRLWRLAAQTLNLFWLFLTKRPGNIARMLPTNWAEIAPHSGLGVSVENNSSEVLNGIKILANPELAAKVKFLSLEPLLAPMPRLPLENIDWVIVGGESGPNYRPMDIAWVREIRDQCRAAEVPLFFKQLAGNRKQQDLPLLDGQTHAEMPDFGKPIMQKAAALPVLQNSLF